MLHRLPPLASEFPRAELDPPLGYSADYLLIFLEDLLKFGGSILGYGQPFVQAFNSLPNFLIKCAKMWYILSAPATSR
jgi:hypothetical protein